MKKLTAGIFTALVGLCAANSADAAVASKGWVEQEMQDKVTETTFSGTNYLNDAVGLKGAATKLDAQVKVNADVIATLDKAGGTGEGGGIAGFIENVSKNTSAIETLNADTSNPDSVASKIASALDTYTTEKSYLNTQTAASTYATIENLNKTDAAVSGLESSKEDASNKFNTIDDAELIQDNSSNNTKFPTMAVVTQMIGQNLVTTTEQIKAIYDSDTETGLLADVEEAVGDAQTTADKGVADAAAAQATANAAVVRKTNNINYLVGTDAAGDIKPIIPAECTKPTNYCVLTYGTDGDGNTGYVWEVIERETTTSQG